MSVKQKRSPTKAAGAFQSKLQRGPDRFLAHVIQHGFAVGCRTAEDFIRHFPPPTIVNALEAHPLLRAKLLVAATGIKGKIAAKKSVASAGEDLRIALEESETDAGTLVDHFYPDDRVRYLNARSLWAYITEGRFWEAGPDDGKVFEAAKSHVAYMLERALADELLTPLDIVEGISVRTLVELLPRTELEMVFDAMLGVGRAGKPFADADLLAELPPLILVEHIPLPLIWHQVIVSRVAEPQDYVDRSAGTRESQRELPPTEPEAPATDSEVRKPKGIESDVPPTSSKASTAEDKAEEVDTTGIWQGATTARAASTDAEAPTTRPPRRKVRRPVSSRPSAAKAPQADQPRNAGAWARPLERDATAEAADASSRQDKAAAGVAAVHPGRTVVRRVRVPAKAGSSDSALDQQEYLRQAIKRVQQVQETGATGAHGGPQSGHGTHDQHRTQAAGVARRGAPPPLPHKAPNKT